MALILFVAFFVLASVNLLALVPEASVTPERGAVERIDRFTRDGNQTGQHSWTFRVDSRGRDRVTLSSGAEHAFSTSNWTGKARLETVATWRAGGLEVHRSEITHFAAASYAATIGPDEVGRFLQLDSKSLGSPVELQVFWDWRLVVEEPTEGEIHATFGPVTVQPVHEATRLTPCTTTACAAAFLVGSMIGAAGCSLYRFHPPTRQAFLRILRRRPDSE